MANLVKFLQGFIGIEGNKEKIEEIQRKAVGDVRIATFKIDVDGEEVEILVEPKESEYLLALKYQGRRHIISINESGRNEYITDPYADQTFDIDQIELSESQITQLKKLLNARIQQELAQIKARRQPTPPSPPPAPQRSFVEFLQGFIQDEVDKGEDDRLAKIAGDLKSDEARRIAQNVVINGKNASLWVSFRGEILVNFGNALSERKYIVCTQNGTIHPPEGTNIVIGDTEFNPRDITLDDDTHLKRSLDDGIAKLVTQIKRPQAPPPPPRPAREIKLVEFLQSQLPSSAEGTPSVSAIQELDGWQYEERHKRFVKDEAVDGHKLYLYPRGVNGNGQPSFVIEKSDGNHAFVYHDGTRKFKEQGGKFVVDEAKSDYYERLTISQDLADQIAGELAGGILKDKEQKSYGELLTKLNLYLTKEVGSKLQESGNSDLNIACLNYYGILEQRHKNRDGNDTNETAELLGRYLTLYSVPDAGLPQDEKTKNLLPKIDELAREVLENWKQVDPEGANPKDLKAAKDSIVQIFHPLGNGINFSAEEGQQNIAQLQEIYRGILTDPTRAATVIQKGWRSYRDKKQAKAEADASSPGSGQPQTEVDSSAETIATPLAKSDDPRLKSGQPQTEVDAPLPRSGGRDTSQADLSSDPISVDPNGGKDSQPPISDETDLSASPPRGGEVDAAENSERENAAATVIQAAFRGHIAKEKYKKLKAADHRKKILIPGSDENKQVIAYAYVLMTLHRYDHNGKISSKEGLKYFINQAQKLIGVTPVKGKFPFDCNQIPDGAMIAAAKKDIQGKNIQELKNICKLRDADEAHFDKVKEGGVSASELMGIYEAPKVTRRIKRPGGDVFEDIEVEDKSFNYYLEFAGIDFKGAQLDFDQGKLFYANFRGCNFDETSVIAGDLANELGTAKFTNCSGDQQAFANGHEGVDAPGKVNAQTLDDVLGRRKSENIANAVDRASGLQAGGIFQESLVSRKNLSEEFLAEYNKEEASLHDVAANRIKVLNQRINAISKNRDVVSFMLARDRVWEYNSRLAANLDDVYGEIVRLGIDNNVNTDFIQDVAANVMAKIQPLIQDSAAPPSRENILVAVKSVTVKLTEGQRGELSKIEEYGKGDFNNVIADNIERFVQSAHENLGKLQKYERIEVKIVEKGDSVWGHAQDLQDAVREKIEIKKFVAREESILKSQNIEIDQTAQAQYLEVIAEQVTDKPMIKELLASAKRGEERLLAERASEEELGSGPASFDQFLADGRSSGLSQTMMGFEPTDHLRVDPGVGLTSFDPQDPSLDQTRHDSARLDRGSVDRTSLEASAQAELERRAAKIKEQNLLSSIGQSGNREAVLGRAKLIAATTAAVKVDKRQPSTTPRVPGGQHEAASQLSGRSKDVGISDHPY